MIRAEIRATLKRPICNRKADARLCVMRGKVRWDAAVKSRQKAYPLLVVVQLALKR